MPYINNVGLNQLLKQYSKENKIKTKIVYRWVQRSLTDNDKAVCEAKIVGEDKNGSQVDLTDWITGEASPGTIKMGTLKGYQNHLAQVRAENRAIRKLIGIYAIEKIIKNIAKKKGDDPEVLEKAANVIVTSAEEISEKKERRQKPTPIIETKEVDPVSLARDYIKRTTSIKLLNACEKKIKENPDFSENNKKYLLNLVKKQKEKYGKK